MGLGSDQVMGAVVIGVGASVLMDLWNLFLRRAFGIRSLDYCLLGRWVRHMGKGSFRHTSIAAAPAARGECPVGWLAHYSIGILLALAFVDVVVADGWLARPSLWPALLYGIGTVVLPYFILQPALGLGVASARAPRPRQARLKSLMTHAVFGVGLYGSALLLGAIWHGI